MTRVRDIAVSYRPTLSDILHAARVAEGEAWRTSSRVVAALLCIVAGATFYSGFPWWAVLFLTLAVVEWFNLLPFAPVVAYLEFKRNPKYRQQYNLTLSPDGLSFTTDTVSSVLKWSHYTRFWETERAFVLSYGVGVPTVIPKAAFASNIDLNDARTLLAGTVGGSSPP